MLVSSRPWRAVAYHVARLAVPALGFLAVLVPVLNAGWAGVALAAALLVAYVVVAAFAAPLQRRLVVLLGHDAIRLLAKGRLN